uniref:Ovule protein n=1 Tax=Elaeophora elaphi TaxID=1147741 RepID=A0A0R3RP00_9BILA
MRRKYASGNFTLYRTVHSFNELKYHRCYVVRNDALTILSTVKLRCLYLKKIRIEVSVNCTVQIRIQVLIVSQWIIL